MFTYTSIYVRDRICRGILWFSKFFLSLCPSTEIRPLSESVPEMCHDVLMLVWGWLGFTASEYASVCDVRGCSALQYKPFLFPGDLVRRLLFFSAWAFKVRWMVNSQNMRSRTLAIAAQSTSMELVLVRIWQEWRGDANAIYSHWLYQCKNSPHCSVVFQNSQRTMAMPSFWFPAIFRWSRFQVACPIVLEWACLNMGRYIPVYPQLAILLYSRILGHHNFAS